MGCLEDTKYLAHLWNTISHKHLLQTLLKGWLKIIALWSGQNFQIDGKYCYYFIENLQGTVITHFTNPTKIHWMYRDTTQQHSGKDNIREDSASLNCFTLWTDIESPRPDLPAQRHDHTLWGRCDCPMWNCNLLFLATIKDQGTCAWLVVHSLRMILLSHHGSDRLISAGPLWLPGGKMSPD